MFSISFRKYRDEEKEKQLVYLLTSESLGEREMRWEHEPQASVSTAFSSSPKLVFLFNNWIMSSRFL